MSNQNLEVLVSTLSAQVVQQGQQIAELQKQLADMQKATSCYFQIKNNETFIKEAVIKSDNFHLNSNGDSCFTLTHGANVKNNKETEAMKVSLIIGNDGDTRVVSELNMSSKSTDTNLFLSKVYASLHELELHQQKSTPSADAILSHLSDELTARGF